VAERPVLAFAGLLRQLRAEARLTQEELAAARGEPHAAESHRASAQGSGPGAAPVWAGCPYLGLVPFQEGDARVFDGRGDLAAQLVQRLAGTGILLLAGESGVSPRCCERD
jgi:hypothetical protein